MNVGRFQLDEVANEIDIIDQKRVTVFNASTGEFKRGWGGHGMPLSEIPNEPIAGYTWTGEPPPEEINFAPTLHFIEISTDRRVYIGERGQNRIHDVLGRARLSMQMARPSTSWSRSGPIRCRTSGVCSRSRAFTSTTWTISGL